MNATMDSSGRDRIPPNSIPAEMALIGSILIEPELYDRASEITSAGEFYSPIHDTIWKAISDLANRNIKPDKVSLAEELRAQKNLDLIGGLAYLSSLMDAVGTLASVEYYARIVNEKFRLRKLIQAGVVIARLGYDGENDVAEAIMTADETFADAVSSRVQSEGTDANRAILYVLDMLDNGPIKTIETQYQQLNSKMGGFAPAELIVIGSNPGMGKTAFVLGIGDYFARRYGPVALFALEMGIKPVTLRYASLYSGYSTKDIREMRLSKPQKMRLADCMADFSERNIRIFDKRPTKTVADIRVACRRMRKEMGLSAVIIDHIGFLGEISESGRESKHERLDRAYKSILALSHELDVPIICVQHMNRTAKGGTPTMFDLRDGGNVEGHANTILIPFRVDPGSPDIEQRRVGSILIEKCREGEVGAVDFNFYGERGLWLEEGVQSPWFRELPPARAANPEEFDDPF